MIIVNLVLKRVVTFLLIFGLLVKPAYAESKLSLSDEIYADIALRGYLNNVSVSLYNGKTGESIGISEAKHWLPASTVKLFTAMYAYHRIYSGKDSPEDTYIVSGNNVAPTESVPNGLPTISEGEEVTLDKLIQLMITQSDNSAFNQLLDIFDRREITSYIQSIGLTHSAVGSKLNLDTSQTQLEFDVPGYGINTTTAEDYTKGLSMILNNKLDGSKQLLDVLKQQKINYMLPLYLPKDVVVAHKHGDLDPLYHDGGIIFGPKNASPYVLSIFSNVGDPDVVAHLSELIYTRDPKLIGSPVTTPKPLSQSQPAIDPIVARGSFDENTKVLAAQTSVLNTQPITAADLGITAKDVSLAQSSRHLPQVFIPADSPFHFLVSTVQDIAKISVDDKAKAQVEIDALQTRIAEAKDLYKRGKTADADKILDTAQKDMSNLSQSQAVKNDAQAQIQIQALSDDRFEMLNQTVQSKSGADRDALIHKVAEQAKNTIEKVQPNLPLASNAVNVTQRPLIGEVVNNNGKNIVVQTAGGQQLTISIDNPNIKVKTKEIPTSAVAAPSPEVSATSMPAQNASLSTIEKGTTVALIGSSVGNTFTPTFVLKNVPRELAAPEPVTVIKVNPQNKTMVISENGVPVQVNVSSQTLIKGADTSIGFEQIRSGDVVVVHGEPLTPVTSPVVSAALSPVPSNVSQSNQPTGLQITSSPGKPGQGGEQASNPIGTQQVSKTQGPVKTTTQTKPQKQVPAQRTQGAPAPKVIQSTSIQVIEKKENVHSQSTAPAKPANNHAPVQSAPAQPAAQPATKQKKK